jgi:tetratricopeptide (TPR) repeat protein
VVGLLIVVGLLASIIVAGIRTARRGPPGLRAAGGAALASICVVVIGVGADWFWEIPAVGAAFLLLAGATVAAADRRPLSDEEPGPETRAPVKARIALPLLAVPVIALLLSSAIADHSIESSQAAVRDGRLDDALDSAERAGDVQPWAAYPHVQEALVRQDMGDFEGAREAAETATEKESTNWETWWVLSQVETNAGEPAAADEALARARSLNPLYHLLQE